MDTFIHFPNVTKLTLIKNDIDSNRPLKINLNQIVPLMQLTRLVIRDSILSISQLIALLRFSLNIESLTFIGVSFVDEPHSLIRRSDQAFSISKTSKVTELRIDDECSLEYVHFFACLCPRVQELAIVTARRQHESIVRFLLSGHFQHLFCLCLRYLSTTEGEQIERMIDCDSRIFHYTIKNDHTGWYLWWW